jgi:SAM-dependent methyltransferase
MQINKYEHISKYYEMCLPGFWLPFKKLFESKIKNKKYNLIDLGCGTGDALFYLEKYIIEYKGIDHSPDMIKNAKLKFPSFEFIVGDILEFNSENKSAYDIALSAADTVNHLLDKSSWQLFFNNAYNYLNKDGIFIFDICTINDHKNNWVNYVDVIEDHDYTWIRKCEYNPTDSIAKTHNYIYILDESTRYYKKFYDVINQVSFEITEVIQMLQDSKFNEIAVYDMHFGTKVDNNTSVATFFCKK